jgi:hypothetical protein
MTEKAPNAQHTAALLVLNTQATTIQFFSIQVIDGIISIAVILIQNKAIVSLDVNIANAACKIKEPLKTLNLFQRKERRKPDSTNHIC